MNKVNFISRDSYKLRYVDMGNNDSPPIFIIGSSIYYPRLFEDPIYDDLHLIFLDHRGFIIPRDFRAKYNLNSIVGDIEAIRKNLGYDKIYLLGHSGHGFMAMEYAKQYEDHVLGLILSNLAPTNSKERQNLSMQFFQENATPDRQAFFTREFKKLDYDLKKNPNLRFNYMNIRMQAHSFYDYKFDSSKLWKNVDNNMNALDFLWGPEFGRYNTLETLNYLSKKVRIILILAKYDYLVGPTSLWDEILKETNIESIVFEASGHNPMYEEAEKYHTILKDFIS